jgi:hypothetical protein
MNRKARGIPDPCSWSLKIVCFRGQLPSPSDGGMPFKLMQFTKPTASNFTLTLWSFKSLAYFESTSLSQCAYSWFRVFHNFHRIMQNNGVASKSTHVNHFSKQNSIINYAATNFLATSLIQLPPLNRVTTINQH